MATEAAPMEQVASLLRQAATLKRGPAEMSGLKLAPRQIVLFPNGSKAAAPEKAGPDYWGAFNPGNNAPVVRISVSGKKDRKQHAMLAGATSYPVPGESEVQQ